MIRIKENKRNGARVVVKLYLGGGLRNREDRAQLESVRVSLSVHNRENRGGMLLYLRAVCSAVIYGGTSRGKPLC